MTLENKIKKEKTSSDEFEKELNENYLITYRKYKAAQKEFENMEGLVALYEFDKIRYQLFFYKEGNLVFYEKVDKTKMGFDIND